MMRDKLRTGLALVLTCWVVGGAGAVGAYEVAPALAGVTVSGRVTLAGPVPGAELLSVHRDSEFCGETVRIEAVQTDPDFRGIIGVVVSLEGVTKGKPLMPEDVTIVFENRTCKFIPRANVAVVGTVMEIRNEDPIMHNTHVRKDHRFGPTVINVVQPAGIRAIQKQLREVGFLDVRCDAHTFMRASVHVFEHPYFAVTDAAGQFELTQVPPGTYRLRIWHETLGTREKTISVPATGPLTLDLKLGLGR